MLPFLRNSLIAGVAIGAVTTLFITLPGPDAPIAQLSPTERDQLRRQIRHRDPDQSQEASAVESTIDNRVSSSGLTLQERQALREQVRGLNPVLLLDNNAISESVAVNESYPDGVSNPADDNSAFGGSNR